MPTGGKSTLTQFLIEERRRAPGATGDLNALITDVSLACKAISRQVAFGRLGSRLDGTLPAPTHARLQQAAQDVFLRANEWGGHLAGMASTGRAEVCLLPPQHPRGKYLLAFDALDGAADVDLNVAVGSIFSITRAAQPGVDAQAADFLQPASAQVCAGYAIHGPATMLVLSLGAGTHAFTLDPMLGEWVLSHPNLAIPAQTREFAIDASNSRFWEAPVKRYVDECLAGAAGPRGGDFRMRWIATLVAETHRILMRGGVFLCPRDSQDAVRSTRPHLLHAAHPIAFLVEQAGGRASDGMRPLMARQPESLHERAGLVFGSADEVGRIERYHQEPPPDTYRSPLFGKRGLFAQAG